MVKKITILEILEPFLYRPNLTLHLAEISRELKTPHPTARIWLNLFNKKGVLKKNNLGRMTQYSLNLDNQNIVDYLVITEKYILIKKCENNLVLKELVSHIHTTKRIVVIFGSSVEDFNSANDVDILTVGETNLTKISKKINKKLHIISVKSLDQINESLKQEIIKKHLIVNGSEQVIRWLFW